MSFLVDVVVVGTTIVIAIWANIINSTLNTNNLFFTSQRDTGKKNHHDYATE